MSNRIFAIGDIHGRYDLLKLLLDKLFHEEGFDFITDKLIFCGDMVDRGPQSMQVLNRIWDLRVAYPENVVVLAGNHEWMMIDALSLNTIDSQVKNRWYWNGGVETRGSFPGGVIPDEVVDWVKGLPLFHKEHGFFFSHAPVPALHHRYNDKRHSKPGEPLNRFDLTWTYGNPENNIALDHGMEPDGTPIIGVCGHIHDLQKQLDEGAAFSVRLYPHYIFADSGCGCYHLAPLSAVEVRSRKVITAFETELNNANKR